MPFPLFANEAFLPIKYSDLYLFSSIAVIAMLAIIILFLFRKITDFKKTINDYLSTISTSNERNQKLGEKIRRQESQYLEIEKLADILELTNNAVIIADTNGNFEWVNKGFTKLYGYNLSDFIYKVGNNAISLSTNPNAIQEGIDQKRTVVYPSYRFDNKGNKIWLQVEFTPVIDKNGNIEKCIFIETDVHLFKVNETEMQQLREEVDQQLLMTKMQRNVMMSKNKMFTDSVNYAVRIQKAILPSEKTLNNHFKNDYFILYKPCEIVSGDFYWISEVYNKTIIAVADCTGHGVPGAFLSILGINFLNEIVSNNKQLKANEILNELRKTLIESLSQSDSNDKPNDGIDMTICIIDFENMKLEFAGANNPLYIIRDNKIDIFKGDRMPIGEHPKANLSFTNHEIELISGDLLYTFTDGFVDQFGWRSGKKYKHKPFRELLLGLTQIPIAGQKIILDNTIKNWKGQLDQVDDILVMGIKI